MYGTRMAVKTTVYLDPADYQRLQVIARTEGTTAAALLREAVHDFAERRAPRPRPRFIGSGHSKLGAVAERAEELLEGMGLDGLGRR